ncbi:MULTISPECIES: hypothetical protein [unclassified Pseudomonas]|jgi:hypothetical protein|uniref:hypothetical protein n=1 Tax=unclassified Pseudomonas TaxID=196821 RepID=UPI0003430E6F|nr:MULTISPECIES: hypothetical protein [unclassified Pseudomonas]EPA96799.1 hypothetical protein PG5_27280 [Pseudomonas sp. G5(2012)]PMZ89818.1 hypothetical protein C1X61_10235 [Pseudomonas sp. FW215-T2]PNA15778.1 hypothetical protein C1X62_03800 [Pseudomonas sp. FW215-R3]PNB37806.1 hypothetical protein C1X63_11500 [Pseudomonas sp. FW305-131]
MSSSPYDEKNEELFEAVTRQLNEALRKLEKDSSLSASVSSLAKLSGVHRNTIYNRKWPLEKLNVIKENRVQQKKDDAIIKAGQKTPEELLELSRLEVIYWFTQLQDARNSNNSLIKKLKETEASRNFYMKQSREHLENINKQTYEISKLQDALALQEEELTFLKRNLSPAK